MTGSLRSTARNPVAIAVMGLLVLVFLILGVGGGSKLPDLLRTGGGDAVVSAGTHAMSSRDFRRVFEEQKLRIEQQNGQEIPLGVLVQNGFDQQVLNAVAGDEAEAEVLSRSGIMPAPSLIDAEIRKMPIAFDAVTGRFSEQQFTQALAEQGLTPREAQAAIADELAQRHFGYAVVAGIRAPRIYAALTAIAGLENRDITYFSLDPHLVPKPAPPTDVQLMAFMKAHAAQLTRPELRTFELVRFSAAALAPTITLPPGAVEKEFAFKKDSLSKPETRSIIQIPVKTAAAGAAAAARLQRGEDPTAIAKSLGVEPVTYADKPQSAIADRKLAAVAFAMKADETRGPVQGDLGIAALKVVKVTPGEVATLESARAKIEADLKLKAAQDRAYDLSQKFDDAIQGGANLATAAQKVGAPVFPIGPVTAQGIGIDGKPNPALNEKILKTAFARQAGEDSDIADLAPGEYFAVHIDKVTPPAPPPLDEIRTQLAQAWTMDQFVTALRAKAAGLVARIKSGASMESVAATVGGHVTHQIGMQRVAAQQYKALGSDFLQSVFNGKPGDVFAAPVATGEVYVARLDAVRIGDITNVARAEESIAPRVAQDYGQDLLEAIKDASRAVVKPTLDLNRARQAIGVDPSTLPTAKGVKVIHKAQ